MNEKKYLTDLEKRLKKSNKGKIIFDDVLIKSIPDEAGVYAVWDKNKIIYVGESGNIRKRILELRRTLNHSLRRNIGNNKFKGKNNFTPATSTRKFPDYIEKWVDSYLANTKISFLCDFIGRKELEEYLVEKYKTQYNNRRKRK